MNDLVRKLRFRSERAMNIGDDVAMKSAADALEAKDKLIAELVEALKPFSEAAENTDANDDYSSSSIWEHSCALDITVGNLRQARRALSKAKEQE